MNPTRAGVFLCFFLLIASTVGADFPALSDILKKDFFGKSWDDQGAEVTTYEARTFHQGRERTHKVLLVTKAETLNREFYVPADWPHGDKPLLPVMSQHFMATIETPTLPHHRMSTCQVRRDDPADLVRMNTSVLGYPGMGTKDIRHFGGRSEVVYFSPHDGEGGGSWTLSHPANSLYEEQLFLTLRSLPFREGLSARFRLYPPQLTSNAEKPMAGLALLEVSREDGEWKVEVEVEDGRWLTFHIAADYPHHVARFVHSDGREMKLLHTERDAFWENLE
ncbi:MAG: hypothetical protein JJU11_11345 [Candidatus Sumerlaeia bacterium]|nr:hypothetical protein [Candidatus Sumerlaeia bacterium]